MAMSDWGDWEDFINEEFVSEDSFTCRYCGDEGVDSGCPVCGMFTPESHRVIDGEMYHFFTNTDLMGPCHRLSLRMKYSRGTRVMFFDDAEDMWKNPVKNNVSIWVHVDDLVRFHRLYKVEDVLRRKRLTK